jgi:hypothetical protein
MLEHPLNDDGRVDLGDGFTLHTSTLTGSVKVDTAASATRTLSQDPLDAALEDAGLKLEKMFVVPSAPSLAPAPPAAVKGARDLGGAAPAQPPSASLEIDVGADEAYVLLVEDTATHVLTWVIPDNAREIAVTGGARALGRRTVRFTIPLDSTAHEQRARGLIDLGALGGLGKKVKAFVFKITDELLGPIIHGFAKKWETSHRPCFVRAFGPDDYRSDDPNFPRLDEAGWRRLSQGRALLFVHGTFSTCGSFAALDTSVIAELSRRYDGRMFAYNHPTLTSDPRENAIALLSSIPESLKLELDIVCHSRGGLVARQIAALGAVQGTMTVRNIVFVGATNAGTVLADDDHMVEMIDRFTTIANFIPGGTVKKILDALVVAVKVIGHGFLHDLEGLRAMKPDGDFLQALNVPGSSSPEYFAIASDFEPKPNTPFLSFKRAEDLAADQIFADAPNDLVVPRDGVFAKNGASGFPIGEARCLKFGPADGVIHTEFFSDSRTGAQLLEWLQLPAVAPFARDRSLDEIARTLDAFRDHALATLSAARQAGPGARGLEPTSTSFSPAELDALRPHVVNLSEGTFKQSGIYSTTEVDVDSIVREHIPRWIRNQPGDQPLRVAIWAHGGLVGERDGLKIALKHVEWWKKNGVYPIYFVWETGLFDALRSILESVARKLPGLGTRDLFDFTTDPLVQEGVRALGGVHVWGAMKTNAELANGANGGARYLATRLVELSTRQDLNGGHAVEFHAIGHSAGSIFHSWFLPVTRQLEFPTFKTLQLLAPAITVEEFDARLAGQIGNGGAAERTIMYTMKKSFEEADNCISVYRKSLLYLIHHALEPQRRTPVLGLEISTRASAAISSLFGLNGSSAAKGRVVWSIADSGDERSLSRSTRHGDFDDDPLTMNSVAANVLNEPRVRAPYRATGTRAIDGWPVANEWLEGVDLSALGPGPRLSGQPTAISAGIGAGTGGASPLRPGSTPAQPKRAGSTPSNNGARRALCVGIDAYPPPNALTGCVKDVAIWTQTLQSAQFEVTPLIQTQATHANILTELRNLVSRSKPGDVLVFQYSGHGTQVPDLDGDEDDGNDEALVPVDFNEGAFLIDDDIRAVFDLLPAGVNLTAFVDCCHSGTITRMLGRNTNGTDMEGTRFLKQTEQWESWIQAHSRFRERVFQTQSAPIGGAQRGLLGANALRWTNFSACDATEVALEHNGNGDFSRHATGLLVGDLSRFTHRAFQDQLIAVFGETRRQTPQLDCPDRFKDSQLLQPLA